MSNLLTQHLPDNPAAEPDHIGVEGSMRYLTDLGVKLDEAVLLAVLTELNAPTMGELTREGFVNGWTNRRYGTLPPTLIYRFLTPTVPKPSQNNSKTFPVYAARSPPTPPSSSASIKPHFSSREPRAQKSSRSKRQSNTGASSSQSPPLAGRPPQHRGWSGGSNIWKPNSKRQ